ncbi:MAG: hypothetical protein WD226_09105 [Planctomycetota bacterium]
MRSSVAFLATLTFLVACTESDDGDSFVVRNSSVATPLASPLTVGGGRVVFLAAENLTAGGTDLNGDLDTTDLVAHTARFNQGSVRNLGVAAKEAFIAGGEIFLWVDEAEDDTDYDGVNGATDQVILHWNDTAESLEYVATVDVLGSFETAIAVGDALYFYESTTPGPNDTTIRRVLASAPTTVEPVETAAGGTLSPRLLGEDEGLVFLALDEVLEGVDLNADTDSLDETVLAVFDGRATTPLVVNTGLAMLDTDAPLDARRLAGDDYLIAVLVDEADQGGVSLNDHSDPSFTQPFLPAACLGMAPDVDTNDQVLHWVRFADLLAGTPGAVGNTGLAGFGRVIALAGDPDGAVATLSDEADASCDLNGDGLLDDAVARWATAAPNSPYVTSDSILRAVEISVPGGSMGLAWLNDRLIAAISEAGEMTDIDGEPGDHALVAWLDPADGASADWTIQHPTGGFGTGVAGEPFAGTTWMRPDPVSNRLAMTYTERVPNLNLNTNIGCAFVQKDADAVDALPVWADFAAGPVLDFDGLGFAVSETAPGITMSGGFVFFRVDETADDTDWNDDGDKTDLVLFRNPLTACNPVPLATSSPGAGDSVVIDPGSGGAFITSEASAGSDLNNDGDMTDFVVRWFSF